MTFDHQSFALKVHIVEAFVLGSVGLFAPAALEAFLGPVPPHAAFNMSAVGALSFALALFFAIRPEPLTREHVKVRIWTAPFFFFFFFFDGFFFFFFFFFVVLA
jgi:hypothetical protein